ncbi:MAG: ClpXP protease specificity-enhancing factor SspB, partial [Burkholderiales bacterium]|nr:ClpXP protease specificity-enhancing factor SspB [Burkholderiales bacterium]
MAEISTRPYLIRALYEWCTDNGYRPYIAVAVDERTIVPREFVRNDEIVLNISATATNRLTIGNELLEFEARFSGVAR